MLTVFLPTRLYAAVFSAYGYRVTPAEQPAREPAVYATFHGLPALQQDLLFQYYSEPISQKDLAKRFSIPLNKCRKELLRGLHSLCMAGNREYREAMERVGPRNVP